MPIPQLRTSPNQLVPNLAQADQNALATIRGRQEMAAYPEDRNYLRQQRANATVDRQNALSDREYEVSQRSQVEMARDLKILQAIIPGMSLDMYGKNLPLLQERLSSIAGMLPTVESVTADAEAAGVDPAAHWENSKAQLSGETPEAEEPDQRAFETWQMPDGTTKNIRKGDPVPDKAIKYKPGGEIIESDGQGGFRILRGGATKDAAPMTRKTEGMLEQKAFDAGEQRIRAEDILAQYDPEFLTIPGKFKGVKLSVMDSLGMDLDPEEARYLDNIKTFQQDAIENINLYIKAITGAQMSEAEAKRLRKAMADAGDGVFTGDGPRAFKAKLVKTLRKAKHAEARFSKLREMGLADYETGEGSPEGSTRKTRGERNKERMEKRFGYERVTQMLKERAENIGIQLEMKYPNMSEDEIKFEIKKQMRERYGL